MVLREMSIRDLLEGVKTPEELVEARLQKSADEYRKAETDEAREGVDSSVRQYLESHVDTLREVYAGVHEDPVAKLWEQYVSLREEAEEE
jgi:hypothetical protein